MTLRFHKTYTLFFISILVIEILIAKFLTQGFIRYTFGDYLVVILMYCFFKSFIKGNHFYIAMGVLAFSFAIEFLQLVNILKPLNLQNSHSAKLILGSTFQFSDLVAYTLGIITVLIVELKPIKSCIP
ncbi:hypothetical protein CJ739_2637 [Mariniflexile rhizosphaerae]|uniref:ribosomal maturation YjgA family protein n=1 Tax=unclassified Mariniflexile TaxID=2643887 RepID=UPI000E33788B|nr:DUF2809 domain-containing protein [Mariniflexile sp. TRM1-10]AXP81709.1 hypothetical protein CJ739_2637 [Mariniflexile sp. TRM1-10]